MIEKIVHPLTIHILMGGICMNEDIKLHKRALGDISIVSYSPGFRGLCQILYHSTIERLLGTKSAQRNVVLTWPNMTGIVADDLHYHFVAYNYIVVCNRFAR